MLPAATAVLLVLAAACGGGPERQVQPTPRPISDDCAEAWRAVQERTGSPVVPSPDDQPTEPPSPVPLGGAGQAADLHPTLTTCGSAEEWMEAFAAYPIDWTRDMNAVTLLREICQYSDPEIQDTQPCVDVAAVDEPLDQTTDVSPQPS